MDEIHRVTGRIINLRHAMHRWLEYAFGAGAMAVAALGVERFTGIRLVPLAMVLVTAAVCFAAIAGHYNIQLLAAGRRHQVLHRANAKQRRLDR